MRSRIGQLDRYKPHLGYDSSRLDWPALEARYNALWERDKYVVLSVLYPFECTWHKVGPEQQLMMLATDPDWLRDIYEADTALLEAAWQDLWSRGLRQTRRGSMATSPIVWRWI